VNLIEAIIRALTNRAFSIGGLASEIGIVVVVKKYKVVIIVKLIKNELVVEKEIEVEVDIVLKLGLLVINTKDIVLVIAIIV
jgi:hypothetical protein